MPRLYAHRGASAELPENTLPSFRRALELGADALELDVHMTADRHVVVCHDPSGRRTSGTDLEIRKVDLATLKRWDAGWGFTDESGRRPHAGAGFQIPTLDEVLETLPGVPLNVDIKQRRPSMVAEVLRVVRAHRAEERVILASFELSTMLAVRASGYRGPTALPRYELAAMLLSPRRLFRRLPLRGDAAQMPIAAGPLTLARRQVIERCHDLGLRADYWTVNDPDLAARLVRLGADGIMTDDPRRIAPVLGKAA